MATIARAYQTSYDAEEAVKELIEAGLSEDRIQVVIAVQKRMPLPSIKDKPLFSLTPILALGWQ